MLRGIFYDAVKISAAQDLFYKKSILSAMSAALAILLLCGFSATSTPAQAVYGSISGTVMDSSGGGVADAAVTITDTDRNIVLTTTTNSSGNFNQTHLIIGHYRVKVEKAGFKTVIEENVEVAVDTVKAVEVTLQPGEISQTITVSDEIPLLKTERTDVSTTLSERQVDELPNFGRNFSNLLLLTPGAVQFCWLDNSTEDPQGGIAVNVNGQMFIGVGTILDGTDNRDFLYGNMLIVPNLDAVVQMKVTSASYDAEFGQVSAALVTTSTKSGTNNFHGSAFYYNRNNSTFARDPFAQSIRNPITNQYIPTTNWNQFGGSVGGPIKKNKLFFFADFQGTRAIDGGSSSVQVPTAAMRGGDFRAWDNPALKLNDGIYNPFPINGTGNSTPPLNRQQFVSSDVVGSANYNPLCLAAACPDVIPTSMISPISLALIKDLPLPTDPNAPPGTPNYSASVTDTYHANTLDGRVDYFYSDRLRFFNRYTYNHFFKSAPGIYGPVIGGPAAGGLGYTGSAPTQPQSNAFGFDYTLRPTLITDFRFGWYKQRINVNPFTSGDFASQAGAVGLNIPGDPSTNDFPHFGIQGPDGFDIGDGLGVGNCNCPLIERMQQFQFANNWTWTKGNHTFKFGPDIKRLQNLRVPSDIHRSGDIFFSAAFTEGFNPAVSATGPNEGGTGTASFLLGYASNMGRYVSNTSTAGEREWRTFFYGQDTWKVTSKLTINYGLRWEIYYPQTVTGKDQGAWIDVNTGEVLVAGENHVGLNGGVKNTFKNLAPRLGIAYQATPKTVVRLGYGRSFDVGMFGTIFGHTATQNLPVLANQSVLAPNGNNPWDPAFALSVGPPLLDPAAFLASSPLGPNGNHLLPPGVTPYVFPRKMLLPTVDAWNATLQRQITSTFSLEAAYVGNKGTHVQTGENNWLDINAASPFGYCPNYPSGPAFGPTGTPCLTPNQRQPYFAKYGWTQLLRCVCDPGDNAYNSLQTKAEKRLSHGLTVLGVYTWSHARNHDAPLFLYLPKLEYGRPAWQRNHVATVATIYELPVGQGKQFFNNLPSFANYIVGGWEFSNNTTWMSGTGFNVSYAGSECNADTDLGVCLPNLVGNPHVAHPSQNGWFAISPGPLTANGTTSGAWQRPAFGTFGNYPRNDLTGPRWFDSDLSVMKSFPVNEQMKFKFVGEIYNVFNHANLGNPNGCVDCGPGSGQIFNLANYGSMRKMQFGLRFEF